MKTAASYWQQRLAANGHTGLADPINYVYDQLERLTLVKSLILKMAVERGVAFDFGCGTGDFSKLLIEMGFNVCGYDPFVKPNIQSAKFIYAANYDEVTCKNQIADLVLSITALDHILQDDDVSKALEVIRNCLKPEGEFYLIECALDAESNLGEFNSNNTYQALRTLSRWTELLNRNSFRVMRVFSIPHPNLAPSEGYTAYSRALLVRIIRRYYNLLSPLKPWRDHLLKHQAAKFVRRHPVHLQTTTHTSLKLIQCSLVAKH